MNNSVRNNNGWLIASGAVICGVFIFLCFRPVLFADFVNWDDGVHVYDNPMIRSLAPDNLKKIFASRVSATYIPLTVLSWALEYRLGGLNPFVYHLDNLFLHLAVVGLVFVLARRWLKNTSAAGLAALIFAIHPMHVEPVAWVTARKDVLYAVFYLLALWMYDRYLDTVCERPLRRRLAASFGFGILSLLAKPMAVSLPLIMLLIDWFRGRGLNRRTLIEKIPFFAAAIGIGLMTYLPHARLPPEPGSASILLWSWTAVFYLRHFLIPFPLIPIYDPPRLIGWHNPEYVLSLVLFILFLLSLGIIRSRWYRFALGYYALSAFFLFRFDWQQDITFVADRYMYLPSFGLCMLAGLLGSRLITRSCAKTTLVRLGCCGGLAAGLAGLGFSANTQCQVWNNSISLWHKELLYNRSEPIAFNNLANVYYEEMKKDDTLLEFASGNGSAISRVKQAVNLYEQAHAADSEYLPAYFNLGCLYQDTGQFLLASREFRKIAESDPMDTEVGLYLAQVEVELQNPNNVVNNIMSIIYNDPGWEYLYTEALTLLNQAHNRYPETGIYASARELVFLLYIIWTRFPEVTDHLEKWRYLSSQGQAKAADQELALAMGINTGFTQGYLRLGELNKNPGTSLDSGVNNLSAFLQTWRDSDRQMERRMGYDTDSSTENSRKMRF